PTCPLPPMSTTRAGVGGASKAKTRYADVTVISVCTEYTDNTGVCQVLFCGANWMFLLALQGADRFLEGRCGRSKFGNFDPDESSLAWAAFDFQAEVCAVQDAEAFAHVAEADAFDIDVGHALV